jgi:NagD protein
MRSGFLIDMDGVIYRGQELIPGADKFIDYLQRIDIPFLFLTNNSQRTRHDVATKKPHGIAVEERHVLPARGDTVSWPSKPNGTAYVIGEGGLLHALHHNGYSIVDKSPDYVVVGRPYANV